MYCLQWEYGASFSQRRSPFSNKPGGGPHQGWRDCGLQDRGQRDPNSTQGAEDS